MKHDVTVHRVVKNTKKPNQGIEMHKHDFFHYIYHISGTQIITVGDRKICAEEGSLVLVPIDTMHMIISKTQSTSLDLKFSCSPELTEKLKKLPVFIPDAEKQFSMLIMSVMEEAVDQKEFCDEMVNLSMYQLLITLIRNEGSDNNDAWVNNSYIENIVRRQDDKGVGEILRMIDNRISENITISELASHLGYCENHFRTFFKKEVGINPNSYINWRKVTKAKEMMLSSNLNITQIAEQLGYQNIQYFSRVFKKFIGLSPREYVDRMYGDRPVNMVNNEHTPSTEYEFQVRDDLE